MFRGEIAAAEQLSDEALAFGHRAQDPYAPLFCALVKYSCMFLRGSFSEMEPMLRRLIERYPSTIGWRVQLAQLYYLMDRPRDTREEIEALGGNDFGDLPIDGSYVVTLAALTQVLQYLNDVQRTKLIYQRLKPYAKFIQIAGNSAISGAPVSEALGVAATTLGLWDEAGRYFEDAVAHETRMGARPWLAWTLCSYARMLQARGHAGDKERAATFLQDAQAIGVELGMKRVAAWAELQRGA